MKAIKCSACGHENDTSRVFCQNCGVRLDKSQVVDSEQADLPAGSPPPSPIKYRASRHSAPLPKSKGCLSAMGLIVREIFLVAVLAFLVACFVQMLRPIDGLPPPTPPSDTAASLLAADVHAAKENPYPRAMVMTPDQINNFLAARLVSAPQPGSANPVSFGRAFVVLSNGSFDFVVEQRLLGLSVYLRLEVVPEFVGGMTTASVAAGSIGRLPVPAGLLPYFQKSFLPTIGSLSGPVDWLSSASNVQISPDKVTVNWVGKRD